MRRTATLSVSILALVLTGCSGPKAVEAQVATLPSTSSASPAPATDAAEGDSESQAPVPAKSAGSARPQMRLDDTDEQRDNLISAWNACLVDHGARYATARDGGVAAGPSGAGSDTRTVADPIPAKARAACRDKVPLMPPELEPELNPHYRDDWRANVKCLREHGYKVHLTQDTSAGPNGLTWTYDEDAGTLPDNAAQIENDCQLTAFGQRK